MPKGPILQRIATHRALSQHVMTMPDAPASRTPASARLVASSARGAAQSNAQSPDEWRSARTTKMSYARTTQKLRMAGCSRQAGRSTYKATATLPDCVHVRSVAWIRLAAGGAPHDRTTAASASYCWPPALPRPAAHAHRKQ